MSLMAVKFTLVCIIEKEMFYCSYLDFVTLTCEVNLKREVLKRDNKL